MYLNLNEQENQAFKTTVDRMGLTDDEQEKYMEIVTSWKREGIDEALEKVAIKSLQMGMTVEVTVQLTGLTLERVQQLQAQLQKES